MHMFIACNFNQPQLNLVDGQRFFRQLIEILQGSGSQSRLSRFARDSAMLAAATDGDVEGGLDLAQIFIERPAEILQPRVVERLQG